MFIKERLRYRPADFFTVNLFVVGDFIFLRKGQLEGEEVMLIGETQDLMEEYYVIFAERMIQHPAVKRVCESDFSFLFAGQEDFTTIQPATLSF